jgi:hypothetical protein
MAGRPQGIDFTGRRGEIVWQKPGLLGGGRLDYDAHAAISLHMPLWAGDPYHTWGWGAVPDRAYAIRLRSDRGFRWRALLEPWAFLAAFLLLVTVLLTALLGAIAWMEQKPVIRHAIVIGAGVVALVACVAFLRLGKRADRRNKDIRLVLGTHSWGSSDPAFWHADLASLLVDPRATKDGKSFAELARRFAAEKDWSRAMWCARLSTLREHEVEGERLTDELLATPDVRERLRRVRKKPERRDEEFGEAVPLETWVGGDSRQHVITIPLG